ncbi:hypothetical protein H8711_04075 [Clostridiaceae bacterium NSJ-31]|uniref:Uncharacterized protein n=1 Tax=Ligaoa zhengdingensis TaxID=2763658 RepID=A0A926I4D3_9FIRM|nr:hypothetical protein [Ligaoa zhengdingensis]MBC8546111.1 hypothetical protein [Ligaoa zhengdingensis]
MVDFIFYRTKYKGDTIPSADFPSLIKRAGDQLARYKRIYIVTAPEADSEGMAVCAMADALYGFDLIANGEGGAVRSASIGSVSASYSGAGNDAVDVTPVGQARELFRCACLYLDIYRGVH